MVPFERIEKPVPAGERPPEVGWQAASGGFFKALGIPLRSGRLFDQRDAAGPPVVIVSDRAAVLSQRAGRGPRVEDGKRASSDCRCSGRHPAGRLAGSAASGYVLPARKQSIDTDDVIRADSVGTTCRGEFPGRAAANVRTRNRGSGETLDGRDCRRFAEHHTPFRVARTRQLFLLQSHTSAESVLESYEKAVVREWRLACTGTLSEKTAHGNCQPQGERCQTAEVRPAG